MVVTISGMRERERQKSIETSRRKSEFSTNLEKHQTLSIFTILGITFDLHHSSHIRSNGDCLHRKQRFIALWHHCTPHFSIIIRLNPIKITHRQTNCETMCHERMARWFSRDDSADLKSMQPKALNDTCWSATGRNVYWTMNESCTKINSPFQIKTQSVDWAIVDTIGSSYHLDQSIWLFSTWIDKGFWKRFVCESK